MTPLTTCSGLRPAKGTACECVQCIRNLQVLHAVSIMADMSQQLNFQQQAAVP